MDDFRLNLDIILYSKLTGSLQPMTGFRFHQNIPDNSSDTPFKRLLKIFLELMVHTSGDVGEALNRMNSAGP